jgi:hypothetical protein
MRTVLVGLVFVLTELTSPAVAAPAPDIEIYTVTVNGMSCSVQRGNVFAN